MKETLGNGFNEDCDSEFRSEELDLLVLDNDLPLDEDPLMNEPQT